MKMKNFLINATNLKLGGGIQVADSICCELNKYPQYTFVVVLSKFLDKTAERIKDYKNVKVIRYDIQNSINTLIWGRDKFLDDIVCMYGIQCVLTVFGPSRWNPKVPHVSGFAMPHLVLYNSPYFSTLSKFRKIVSDIRIFMLNIFFKRSARAFYTENEYITHLLKKKWPEYDIRTITNTYNQIFDDSNKWTDIKLPKFDGVTMLCISANYPHKNLEISKEIAKILKKNYPDFKFRFVFTLSDEQFEVPVGLSDNFILLGKVDISSCPSLYSQSDICFQPSLLECFTATYVEAMRMGKPIITTDLEFAHGICQDAVIYYSPLSAEHAAECIYRLSCDKEFSKKLVEAGKERLKTFDTAITRVEKILAFCEQSI